MLLKDGFGFYKVHNRLDGSISWRCDKSRRVRCKATAITKPVYDKEYVEFYGEHIHPPNQ